ncbi:MAG: serine hydrolase domain-containing protein, partial [Anaerolineae bacterium]|nr:serine hydrolase domain-containing protein [Anaerolineae bacterium]
MTDPASFGQTLAKLVSEQSQAEQFSGVILVQHDGEILFREAFSYANRSWAIKNQVETSFRIASISKMFTAVAILQLIEQGRLTFDTEVVPLLSLKNTEIPPQVTIYHLLTMTAGIADWFDESGDWEANWAALCREQPLYLLRNNRDYLPLFVNQPPLAAVGERYQYNGAGYILLGLIIEQVTGQPYFEAIRRQVFEPAGMTDTDFIALDGVETEVAEGYIPLKDSDGAITGWRKNIYATTPEAAADGGATSTAPDLIRFTQALRVGKLLSAEMTQEILTPKVVDEATQFRG